MTSKELNLLKAASGYGTTAIYRVAHIVGRIPYAWEVVYFTQPKGRKSKYHSTRIMSQLKLAWEIWDRIRDTADSFDLGEQEQLMGFISALLNEHGFDLIKLNIATAIISKWSRLYEGCSYEALTDAARLQFLKDSDDLMLEVTMALKDIIHGGYYA